MTAVGPGVLAKMAEQNDHPLTDEQFHGNSDGTVWSETIGAKGHYYASNASGSWEVIFDSFRQP